MIDSEFIIRYTNALYSTPKELAPTYEEFRDMFSSGQIKSKEWFLHNLRKVDALLCNSNIIVVGSWFGTLGLLIQKFYPENNITLLDIDPRCKKYVDNIIYDIPNLRTVTEDMFLYKYSEDIIINTSCEHIENINDWLSLIPKNKVVFLQSNNFFDGKDHVNCSKSLQEFTEMVNLSKLWFSDELKLPMYTRFMIIGVK